MLKKEKTFLNLWFQICCWLVFSSKPKLFLASIFANRYSELKKKKAEEGWAFFFFACIFYRLSFKVLVQQSGSADLIRTLLRSQARDFSSSALLWLLVLIFTLIRVLDTASEPQTHPEECTHFSCLRNHFQSLSASLRLQLPPLIWCPCR